MFLFWYASSFLQKTSLLGWNRNSLKQYDYSYPIIICEHQRKKNLEFITDTSNRYTLRVKPKAVKRQVIEKNTSVQTSSTPPTPFIIQTEANNVFLPTLVQLASNSLEAFGVIAAQLLALVAKKEVNMKNFYKRLMALFVGIWIVLRLIATIPLLPQAFELLGLITSVVLFYRSRQDKEFQYQIIYCLKHLKAALEHYLSQ